MIFYIDIQNKYAKGIPDWYRDIHYTALKESTKKLGQQILIYNISCRVLFVWLKKIGEYFEAWHSMGCTFYIFMKIDKDKHISNHILKPIKEPIKCIVTCNI